MNGAKLVGLFEAKEAAGSEERIDIRPETQTEQTPTDFSGETDRRAAEKSPPQVLTWERVRLKGSRIEQPWHERLRQIRGDQDLNF